MKRCRLLILTLIVLGLAAAPASARAATLDIQVEVLVDLGDGFSFNGVAPSNGTVLNVFLDVGDTIRFIVGLSGTLSENLKGYGTTVTADDPGEIDYLVGSQTELSGLGFNSVANPNNTLNDATPGSGQVNGSIGSVAPSVDKQLYQIDYVAGIGLDFFTGVDFSITGSIVTQTGQDAVSGTANVQVSPLSLPEPASLLLLGGGLAGMAGFRRMRNLE